MTEDQVDRYEDSRSDLSIVLPARNEAEALTALLPELTARYPRAEVLVVDDGSTDGTADVCADAGVSCVTHPESKGNGAAVKTGARRARGSVMVFMDADGQHRAADLAPLLARLDAGYDLVVGARQRTTQASFARWLANACYNRLASLFVGRTVADLTSGLRACRAAKFREFLSLLPNGFSYPATSTMAFFRAGYLVAYEPITIASQRAGGKSHVRLLRDGARFFLIIFRIGTLYSPLKMFLPISALFFLAGLGLYAYKFGHSGHFTNGIGLLFITSILIFLIGLVSEQITQLLYANREPAASARRQDAHSESTTRNQSS